MSFAVVDAKAQKPIFGSRFVSDIAQEEGRDGTNVGVGSWVRQSVYIYDKVH